jgi:hypothetical protein
MTTPRTMRPGKVPGLAIWVPSAIPDDLSLPAWVDRVAFLAWLQDAFESYAEAQTRAQLSDVGREHRAASVPWLKAALRELRRGDVTRLVHFPGAGMPGHAHASCYYQAFKVGQDFDALVRRKDVTALVPIVTGATAALEREQMTPRAAGRRSMRSRDALLGAIIRKLRECRLTEWRDDAAKEVTRAPTVAEAAEWADAILIACGAPSASLGQHVSAIKRAARRGK